MLDGNDLAIFFSQGYSLKFFLFSLIYGGLGLGLLGYGVGSGLRGQGFQLMGFWACCQGLFRFFWD